LVLRDEATTEAVALRHYGRVQLEQSRAADARDRQMPGEPSPPRLPGSVQDIRSGADAKPITGPGIPETRAQ
jgi:hypothetical protein